MKVDERHDTAHGLSVEQRTKTSRRCQQAARRTAQPREEAAQGFERTQQARQQRSSAQCDDRCAQQREKRHFALPLFCANRARSP